MNHQEGRDRLTNLPEDILLHILSFLETKHAIRTCLLVSKSWKSLWPSIPIIRLDYKSTKHPSFNKLIHNIMSRRKSHHAYLREFLLEYVWNAKHNGRNTVDSRLERILAFASSNNVQVFNLSLRLNGQGCLRRLPAMFRSITTLKLEFVDFELKTDNNLIGGVAGFPALTCLYMRSCFFFVLGTNISQLHLLSGCPNLKVFRLVNCRFYEVGVVTVNGPELVELDLDRPSLFGPKIELQIFAPKVERFSFSDIDSIRFSPLYQLYLPSIVQARISLVPDCTEGSPYFLINLLQSLSNAEYVTIDTLDTAALSSTLDKLGKQPPPPPFPRLKYLKLVNLYPHTLLPLDVESYLLNGSENVRLEITRTD